ncbi:hypothetical protein BZA05DRAFT_411205 [Tricharina praecox]|uniref:uncharacterized protein n=1 Tax=Tricharina praecox TaxID=43433 RepID=UPI002220093F|nr:uncharacterized protein BZA05DRAFT_411205 [Tricharina praecox]KAI5843288.1 hypothetical protein BZA05DRAFT_411205 [Tricharina praecox]
MELYSMHHISNSCPSQASFQPYHDLPTTSPPIRIHMDLACVRQCPASFTAAPYSLRSTPLYIIVTTSLLQLLFSHAIRHILERRLPKHHRYHTLCPEIKRRINAQPCALLMKPLIAYFTAPFFGVYLRALFSGHLDRGSGKLYPWTIERTQQLDCLLAVYASMYIFDISHHQASLPYFIHHFVSLLVVLATRTLAKQRGHVVLTEFFTPFFVPRNRHRRHSGRAPMARVPACAPSASVRGGDEDVRVWPPGRPCRAVGDGCVVSLPLWC